MKKYLVIGNPIEHSLSPKIHNFWLKKHNIDAIYEQEKFTRISNSFDEVIFSERQKLDQIKSLKKSIIQDLISDRKRVNV